MASDVEKRLKAERAERLVWARRNAGFSGPTPVCKATGVNINSYKAYEAGRNGFGMIDAITFAELFHVSLMWLMFGRGEATDEDPNIPRRQQIEALRKEMEDRIRQASDQELSDLVEAMHSVPRASEDTPPELASHAR